MKRFIANFDVIMNAKSEIYANSIEEAKIIIENEISNAFQIVYIKEKNQATIVQIYAFEAEIDERFNEFEIDEIEEFNYELINE